MQAAKLPEWEAQGAEATCNQALPPTELQCMSHRKHRHDDIIQNMQYDSNMIQTYKIEMPVLPKNYDNLGSLIDFFHLRSPKKNTQFCTCSSSTLWTAAMECLKLIPKLSSVNADLWRVHLWDVPENGNCWYCDGPALRIFRYPPIPVQKIAN